MMEYRRLGRTDLKISALTLGTMTFGQQNTEAQGHAQMDLALEHGINCLDTAEIYAIPPKPETQGSTERIVGSWMRARKNRDKIVLATKVAGRSDMTWLREDNAKTEVSKAQITQAIEGSLKRLQTDYIDLYQVHFPDRPMQLFGGITYKHIEAQSHPIEETVEILGGLVKAGKVRHIGVSNETPWGTMKYLAAADNGKGPHIVSIQNAYSLLNRVFEQGLSEIAIREQVGLLAYSSLAQGVLTGKYLDGARPQGSRRQLFNRMQRYETPGTEPATHAYVALAAKYDLDPSQMALAFVYAQPFVTSVILGATTLEQLKTDLGAATLKLSDAVRGEIEAVHLKHTNPCP